MAQAPADGENVDAARDQLRCVGMAKRMQRDRKPDLRDRGREFLAQCAQKDIRLVLAAAEDLCVPLPVANLLRDRFLTLLAHGGEKLDWSAIGQLAAKDAGEAWRS